MLPELFDGIRKIAVVSEGRIHAIVQEVKKFVAPTTVGMGAMTFDLSENRIHVVHEQFRRTRDLKTHLLNRTVPIGRLGHARAQALAVGNVSQENTYRFFSTRRRQIFYGYRLVGVSSFHTGEKIGDRVVEGHGSDLKQFQSA